MLTPDLLSILCCPETHQGLARAEAGLVAQLNQKIAAGTARNRAGQAVSESIEGGLIRADGRVLYPIRQDIPVLLIDEGILLQD